MLGWNAVGQVESRKLLSQPSLLREPEGNSVAERFIRTLKENFLWNHTFDTVEELRRALLDFARHYNEFWLVTWHGYYCRGDV